HASSISTIGPAPGPGAASDESVPFPAFAERYVYHRSKRDGERIALRAAADGRDVVVANIGFILGPDDFERVTGWMVERYLEGLIRFVVDGGLSFFDVRDAARGLVLLEERGRAGERTILTNRTGNLSLRDFYAKVGEITGVRRRQVNVPVKLAVTAARLAPWVVHADEVEAVANWWFYDPGKAERELGLAPRPVDETIADTAAQCL
ncbi:MAG: hypothetical protein L0206_24365, partial [Actinobacteria bacterium]|nr:hypothetical protein [Actinomycetota bacterium]